MAEIVTNNQGHEYEKIEEADGTIRFEPTAKNPEVPQIIVAPDGDILTPSAGPVSVPDSAAGGAPSFPAGGSGASPRGYDPAPPLRVHPLRVQTDPDRTYPDGEPGNTGTPGPGFPYGGSPDPDRSTPAKDSTPSLKVGDVVLREADPDGDGIRDKTYGLVIATTSGPDGGPDIIETVPIGTTTELFPADSFTKI